MNYFGLVVKVCEPSGYNMNDKRCGWLGHQSYRCGNCRKGFVRVRSLSDYDEKCPECKWYVTVRRANQED